MDTSRQQQQQPIDLVSEEEEITKGEFNIEKNLKNTWTL